MCVWLFGVISFGYLAHDLLDYHINKHRYHHYLKQSFIKFLGTMGTSYEFVELYD
jgi:hypothetical protein